MIEHRQLENKAPLTGDDVDTHYFECYIPQASPHTELIPGYSGPPITFEQCRLDNCDLPAGSIVIRGVHGHYLPDPANDETVTIDGEAVVIPAIKFEKVGTV